MADSKLSALVAMGTTPANNDELYIRDVSAAVADQSLKIVVSDLLAAYNALSATMTNKSMSETQLTFTDVTTGNVSTSQHGFAPKATAGQVLEGTAFTATPTLGASGTLGSLTFGNATSGTVKLQPVTGALGTVTLSLPAATDTLIGRATTDTLTNKTASTQSANDNSTKLATTAYVDNAVLGTHYKEAVKYATTAALPASTYSNGVAGVGATLTEVGLGALSIDSNTPAVADRVLIKNQASTFQNGIYTVTTVGDAGAAYVLTRSTDTDESADYKTGDAVFVTAGTTNISTTWTYNGVNSPTMGTTAITYVQSSSATPGSIIMWAMIAPQVNISSAGDTYTDTAGNTYAETTNQTRMTLTALRARTASMKVSGKVSAGTGTFQFYNFTDSVELATATTTATTETAITGQNSNFQDTNIGDALTIRVKNSGAGNTITISDGGLIEGDSFVSSTTNLGASINNSLTIPISGNVPRVWVGSIQLAVLRAFSTDTFTSQVEEHAYVSSTQEARTAYDGAIVLGAAFTNAANGTVITRTPTERLAGAGGFVVNQTAAAGGRILLAYAAQLKADQV